ncbi:hypothetical protein F2P56_010783 [Juglans regia]|uniref:PGG domain-containing protein n=1 Tax=Juglans regia TaxID=51240 RepID=A0A834CTH9_JUGRE|nr:hypothetical protein F2P56_010783 [Juglans regia]
METNTFPLELLTNDNYADWSIKMKNNLLAEGLWDIVETSSEPPKPVDDVVEFEAWKKMNDVALHAIQSSCDMDILSQINKISFAKIAWETLAEMFVEMRWVFYNIVEQGHSCSSNISISGQDMPRGTGANQQVESENSSDNQGRSNSSNISSNGHDKLIQAEAVDPIINEGNSSSAHKSGPERENDYAVLVEAVRKGDWITTRGFLEDNPAALTARIFTGTYPGGTILHAAVDADQEYIVQELVNKMSEHNLAIQDNGRQTALHITTISGNQRMAECLITKNRSLVSIRDKDNDLPVALAMAWGHKELARYLYFPTPLEDLVADYQGPFLLNSCIYNRDLDMALDLMERCPLLAFASDHRSNMFPLEVLAVSTEAFGSGKGMVFWKQWIYNHCIHDISEADLDRAANQFRLNIQNHGQENTTGSVRADLWRQLASSLLNLLGFKRLYEMKLVRAQFQQLLYRMCKAIPTLNTITSPINLDFTRIIESAIRRGNFEFVYHMVKENSDIFWMCDHDDRTIFNWAVLHRQHRIFSLIYSLKQKNVVLNLVDKSRNTILHMAGMLTENTPIDHIRGAALQMQREVQWFQEVERICPLTHKEISNKYNLTARQLFTKDHKEMRKDGEKWMKGTATSCTVVGALIITIMFAAAFTIPGGNNQDTGLPILVHDKLFKLFIVTDSLSLFSSSTSVLMFLGILTSRYAEEDFLISLPRKMIIGLFALFFSIATMMIAFSAALLLMLRGEYWIVAPIIGLAGVPIILFVFMQFRLLVDMFHSTYGPGIFDRKMEPWL